MKRRYPRPNELCSPNSGWRIRVLLCTCCAFALMTMGAGDRQAISQEQTRDGDWMTSTDPDTLLLTLAMTMKVHPAMEPKPALSVQFMPDDYERLDGNAAMFYLKATGFFEQTSARKRLTEIDEQANKLAGENGESNSQQRPWIWLETDPADLPIDEVKEFLSLTSFQPNFLKQASMRRGFSMDRHIEKVDDPIGYLLPEVQAFRETARMQSLRTRVAIAEGRIEDAIAILGQQFSMAGHLCQDDFLVSGLVGIAVHSYAWQDALYLAQHAEAPNLYWAFASLPDDLISMPRAYSFERNVLYEQIKVLKEVGEEPRSLGYWNDFIDRLLPQIRGLGIEGLPIVNEDFSTSMQRAQLIAFIAASYPSARRYLIEDASMDQTIVESYPTTQTVMLAICKFHDQMRDQLWKWKLLPYHQARASEGFSKAERLVEEEGERLGLISSPSMLFLPAMQAVVEAECLARMRIALSQTVESLRAYAAENHGRLPISLDNLSLPAPISPFTGRKVDYEVSGERAILIGNSNNIRYRLVVEIVQ